jgi:hypothetical protein
VAHAGRLRAFEGGQPRLELVDPVSEDLKLGLVGQPLFCDVVQARPGLGAVSGWGEGHQPLRPVRVGGQPGRDPPGPLPVALGGAVDVGTGGPRSSVTQSEPSS